jgi:nitrate reductase alpha subunit
MKKKQTPPKATVAELVLAIDSQLNAREEALNNRDAELDAKRDAIAKEREELDLAIESLAKEKADFAVSSQEVQVKFSKIRSDEALSQALSEQAIQAKDLEKREKAVANDLALVKLQLEKVAQRETAVSKRESEYKEEIKKEFASNLFKA